jgi:hypothetical protein
MPAARAIVGWIVADHGDAAAPPSPLTFTAEVAEEGKTLTGEISEVANSLAISAAKAKGMGNIYVGATLFIGGLILFLFLFFTQITSQPQINREQELRNQLYTLQASLPKASSDPEREIIMGEIKVTENQMEALTSTLTRSSDLLATALSNISSAIIMIGGSFCWHILNSTNGRLCAILLSPSQSFINHVGNGAVERGKYIGTQGNSPSFAPYGNRFW